MREFCWCGNKATQEVRRSGTDISICDAHLETPQPRSLVGQVCHCGAPATEHCLAAEWWPPCDEPVCASHPECQGHTARTDKKAAWQDGFKNV